MEQIITIPEDIEYVAVEIIDKDAQPQSCEIVAGLFEGLIFLEKDNVKQIAILMAGPKDAVDIYSFKYYNIMTLIILGKNAKAMTYFTLDAEDQKIALETLKTVVIKMRMENRMVENDPDIIDISTFRNVSDDIRKPQKTTSKIPNNDYSSRDNSTVAYVKEVPEPSIIKRVKTKKPTKKVLFDMITKITNMRKGVFTATLPEILGDVSKDEDEDEDDFASSHYYT